MALKLKNTKTAGNQQRKQDEKRGKMPNYPLLDVVDNVRPTAKEGQYTATCPAHDDDKASLSIRIDGDKALLNCHAGCETEDVVEAVGLTMADLFVDDRSATSQKAKPASVDKPADLKEAPRPRRKLVDAYPYLDADDQEIYQKRKYEPKEFVFRREDEWGNWIYDLEGVELILYRLPELMAADPAWLVFIAEGEKDVDRLRSLGLITTCNPDGVGKWREGYNQHLDGRHVVAVPDNDKAGREHAEQVARSLAGVAESTRILVLEGLPPKGDVSDWLDAGHEISELLDMAEAAPEWEPSRDDTDDSDTDQDEGQRESPTLSELAIEIVKRNGAEFIRSDDGDKGYIRLHIDGHFETWAIFSREFKRLLRRLFYEHLKKPLMDQTLTDVLATLNAIAVHDGRRANVATRIAGHDGAVYVDLCDADWRVVKVTKEGWSVVSETPIVFERNDYMKPLPMPQSGGKWQDLRRLLNATSDDVWLLLRMRIVGAFNP